MATIFDKIVSGEIDAYVIWQDDRYMAFLTPFPNTPGETVVIPKSNPGDYAFALEDEQLAGWMSAVKKVANLLEKAFDTSRVAMAIEGTGVAYLHAKLYPLHGELGAQTNVWPQHTEFYPEYVGYFTTVEGPKMPDDQLRSIQQQILNAAQ